MGCFKCIALGTALGLGGLACTGELTSFESSAMAGEDAGPSTEDDDGLAAGPSKPGELPPLLEQGTCADATPSRLWRLSHRQYENAVAELLGASAGISEGFEPEASGTGFRNGAAISFVSDRLVEDYSRAAEELATRAVADSDSLLSCDASSTSCAQDFIEQFGAQAFRRELSAEQRELYMGLYEIAPGPEGIALVIEALLQSPNFLYRFELGTPGSWGERVPLEAHELAAQLSFLLWDAPPDEMLRDAAENGLLDDKQNLVRQLERMLDDPRALNFYWKFIEQYFDFDVVPSLAKNQEKFPSFSSAVKSSLVEEAHAFSNDVVWERSGTLAELLTSNRAFLDEDLADYYGVEGVSGSDLRAVTLPEEERVGLLTHAGFLAVQGNTAAGSPTLRGRFVRAEMLCHEIPEPPDDVDDAIDPPGASTTTRERYEEHLVSDSCKGCHALLDPIGFGLENYDGIGRYRTTENGQLVDPSGQVANLGSADIPFTGPRELVAALLSSDDLYDCVATHFFRYVLGRLEESYDECTVEQLRATFRQSDGSLSELLYAVTQSGAFTHRVKQ